MMSQPPVARRHGPPPLAYRTWAVVDERGQRRGLAAALVLVVAATWMTMGSVWPALGAAALLLIVMWRMWVPISYELNSLGVSQTVLGRKRRLPWLAVAEWTVRPDGILLHPHGRIGVLDPFRALLLPWGNHREAILAHCEAQLERAESTT